MCSIQIEPVIETQRLRLRLPRMTDAPRVAKLLNDRELARMTHSIPHPYGLEDAQSYLAQADDADARAMFVIDHPEQGPVGVVGFDSENGAPEMECWIGRPFWGLGFATEAAQGALVWAHRDWKRRYVLARHFSDNPASASVLCKTGFLYTGEVKLSPSAARGEAVPSRMMVWLA
ncbi:GNAT family N-acetyltransferase [Phenylobacterium sp. 20VBR1]|uniref:GNAT family N-acetyltransferase n=1 Tax=Phenylobacterium glaciei TaxID=2803784 RepID=A0A941D559_9CAUL|nr:GNAT family N-acetyltransferase [Phenylobacterium glaciei]MBR7621817.1 GNAT family N-acetyltransferase [Phenylobacterium glaciei]